MYVARYDAPRLASPEPIERYDLESNIGEGRNIADRNPEAGAKINRTLTRVRTNKKAG